MTGSTDQSILNLNNFRKRTEQESHQSRRTELANSDIVILNKSFKHFEKMMHLHHFNVGSE